MQALIKRFADDDSGATAIEYGLIAALISIAIIGAMTSAGSSVSAVWDKVAKNVNK